MGRTAPDTHPDPVATTWALSMQRLREESPAAADLMDLCAFFAPDDIPREVIAGGGEILPEPLASTVGSTLAMGDVAAALRRYSLMTVDADARSVHRLVQQVVREGMPDDDCQGWWERAAQLLSDAMPPNVLTDPTVWPTYSRLLPHVRAVTETATEPGSAAVALGRILNQGGIYLQVRAQFGEAAEMLRKAVQAHEDAYGADCVEVAISLSNLGNALRHQADLSGAKACFERAQQILVDTHGPDHPQVAANVSNLGGVLRIQGDLGGAKECYERALRIQEDTYGPDHAQVAAVVNNLGAVLETQGDLDGAKECCERALRIDEGTHGHDHPDVAYCVNNLGSVLFQQGDMRAALKCAQRALRMRVKFLGVDHPLTVQTQRNVDAVLAAMRG